MSSRHTSAYDLKLLVDCYFKAGDGLYVADGFWGPSKRLERRDLIERDPFDIYRVRITTRGATVVGRLIDHLAGDKIPPPWPLDIQCPVCKAPVGRFCDVTAAACHRGRYETSPGASEGRRVLTTPSTG